jgi:hypothetical protein
MLTRLRFMVTLLGLAEDDAERPRLLAELLQQVLVVVLQAVAVAPSRLGQSNPSGTTDGALPEVRSCAILRKSK